MNKYKFMGFVLMAFLMLSSNNFSYEVQANTQTPAKAVASSVISVSPIDVVNCPEKYLGKNISFTGKFVAFTALGLDYKPAFKDGSKYIGLLIERSDVKDHVIPLSEMKILVKRDDVEKVNEIDQGDKVKITGKVFSTALGDPWVDVFTFENLTPKENKTDKK